LGFSFSPGPIALLLAVAVVGCTSHPPREAGDVSRPLLPPASLGAERAANQIVRGAFGEREMTINCVVTVQGGTMSLVGLSAMGVRLFTIKYDGKATSIDKSLPIPAQLTPERLLADLQLVYWPLAALKQPLQASGWQVTEPVPGTRRLRRDTQLVAEVHYASADPWAGRSWLVNLEHGYTLSIESKTL
jgi:Protein of unknown function (DUF3261)